MGIQTTISLSSVLDAIDSALPFNMIYVTASVARGTGGEIKHRSQWVGCQADMMQETTFFKYKANAAEVSTKKARPKIRNIMNPITQEVRSVHIRLICEFNGMRVV